MKAEIELDWADGRHRFALGVKEWEELEDLRDAGLPLIFQRLIGVDARFRDVRETIRLGLIGAGMAWPQANRLIARYVEGDQAAWLVNVKVAAAIIGAAIRGKPSEPLDGAPGEPEAAETPPPAPTSSASTASEP
jgi:hypothetical protein